jgi:hypothetical protein
LVAVEIEVPDALEAGVYANAAIAWHSSQEFTLDFLHGRDSQVSPGEVASPPQNE